MPKLPRIVETVADNEFVLDLESDIFHGNVDLTAARLAQQARGSQRFRLAGAQHVLEIMERETRIDDIFDDNDVPALQRGIEILEQANFARALRCGTIARHGDEVERDGAWRHRAREVGEKHESALQHGHEVQRLAVGIVGVDPRGEFVDALLNVFCGEERCHSGANDNMKRFEIITEADARLLDVGETVALRKGGHVTPLAADTLKARRVTVVSEEMLDRSDEGLAPVAEIRRIAIGSDHSGLSLKAAIVAALRAKGIAVDDLGTLTADPVDYPDTAARVAKSVARGEADAGIVIDGAGIGSAIAANKIAGVRAAVCHDQTMARYARQHNGANVLSLGCTLIQTKDALDVVNVWLNTPMTEARYVRRLAILRALEGGR